MSSITKPVGRLWLLVIAGISLPQSQHHLLRIFRLIECSLVAFVVIAGVQSLSAYWKLTHVVERATVHLDFAELQQAERLPVLETSNLKLTEQETKPFQLGQWSGDRQILLTETKLNSLVRWKISVPTPGQYQITVFLTKSIDYGVIQFYIGKAALGLPIDLWSGSGILSTGPIDLGIVSIYQDAELSLKIVGRNGSNKEPFFRAGIDGVRLVRQVPI